MKRIGKIIYLTPSNNIDESVKIIYKREQKRQGDKDYSEIKKLFKLRKPVYEKIYDLKFVVRNKSPREIVKDILQKI